MKLRFKYSVIFYVLMIVVSCDRTEIRYQYYDSSNNSIKTRAEYKAGKLNGLMATYSSDGKLLEVSEWMEDLRHGKTISFYTTGDTAAIYSFRQGKAFGEYRIFYENGNLQKVGFVADDGFTMNRRIYSGDGSLFPVEPIVGIKSDTINLGDTLVIRGTLDNIQDNKFSSGFMIVGRTLTDGYRKDYIKDTLAISTSDFNDYTVKLVPNGRGDFGFVVQFAYKFNKGINVDTIVTFTNKLSVYMK